MGVEVGKEKVKALVPTCRKYCHLWLKIQEDFFKKLTDTISVLARVSWIFSGKGQ